MVSIEVKVRDSVDLSYLFDLLCDGVLINIKQNNVVLSFLVEGKFWM